MSRLSTRRFLGRRGSEYLNDYYQQTADSYDVHEMDVEHDVALGHLVPLLRSMNIRSILDVGCGTGRVIRHLREYDATLILKGVDPSRALLDVGIEKHGIPSEWLVQANGESLPFQCGEFDAAIATAVLHHVESPERVIDEMLRVSRIGIFISDTNTYGQGTKIGRLVKVASRGLGLFGVLQWIRHGGTQWIITEGDGASRAYSVYDSVRYLANKCEQLTVIPTKGGRDKWETPLWSASHALVIAVKAPSIAAKNAENCNE